MPALGSAGVGATTGEGELPSGASQSSCPFTPVTLRPVTVDSDEHANGWGHPLPPSCPEMLLSAEVVHLLV